LRHRLQSIPPLDILGLRDCQVEAITGLESSLMQDKPRSLIQMATGAGKTFTACNFTYRLVKYAKAKRILFLVDRNNLGRQTNREFQAFEPSGLGKRFTDTYIVQHLSGNCLDPDAKIIITTIQRLYAMLRGEVLDPSAEEDSGFEQFALEAQDKTVSYNPAIPIDFFDFIITDECHRSIYGVWRQVLEYFDAYIFGLTATPSKHTLGFFNKNLVSEYPFERSVADGVNVGYEIYRIRTQVTEQGSTIESEYTVPVRDRRTRAVRYQYLDDGFEYTAQQLDRDVTTPNQIRAVIECYKERLFTDLFPERTGAWVPKTVIFAKDDNHAEEIVHVVREVFNEGNDFAKKITYRADGDPETMIKSFRVDPFPRIVVTVDMIATGTDVKPVEVVLFMRDVKSEGYFEQMKGRGCRSINNADLQQVTPDAKTKTRFIIIDAVGVTESEKSLSQPLERKRNVSFEKLMAQIAQGRRDDDALSSLAARLSSLDKKIEPEDHQRIASKADGLSLRSMANMLLDAIDPDVIAQETTKIHGDSYHDEQLKAVKLNLVEKACEVFDKPEVRKLLQDIKQKSDIVIDEITTDKVLSAGFDLKKAEETIRHFEEFIEKHKDELTALQIIYNQPYGKRKLTYAAIKELALKLTDPPYYLTTADIWQSYKRLEASRVRGAPIDQVLTEVVQLVRFSIGIDAVLEPFDARVEQRFNLWVGRQKKKGREFDEEQLLWLKMIKNHIAANIELTMRDFMEMPMFTDLGGLFKAKQLFGPEFDGIVEELQEVLVA
jgi:type I restriction enzyme R subunit